jgi:hypothetical protein
MAVTKKKLSSYVPPKTIDELKGNPDVFIPIVEKNKNNYVLPLDDLLNNAEDVVKVYRTDMSGREYTVDELKFIQKAADNAQIKSGSTNFGSTVPPPSIATDEGKVPVAYYRDGRGYYNLEKYKDSRIPDSSSSNVGQTLIVDSHGVAHWDDGNIFIATYNVTTLAEIETAINAGKGIMLKVSNTKFIPMSSHVADGSATFTSISTEGNMFVAGVKHYFVTSAGWRTSPEYYNGNNEIHIPSCITANVTTALSDTSSTWATIGNIIIGGHGTQGGGIDINVKHIYSSGTVPVQYHTVFRTTATGGGEDNTSTFGELTLSTSWTRLFPIGQYSGTNNVRCQLEADIWYTQTTPPTHYKLSIFKYWDGTNTRLLISARECWGDSD